MLSATRPLSRTSLLLVAVPALKVAPQDLDTRAIPRPPLPFLSRMIVIPCKAPTNAEAKGGPTLLGRRRLGHALADVRKQAGRQLMHDLFGLGFANQFDDSHSGFASREEALAT